MAPDAMILVFWMLSFKPTFPLSSFHFQEALWFFFTFCHKGGIICIYAATATAKLLQSYPTLCDPTDGSPSGSSVPGILQARTLEWVAISFSNAWKWKVKVKSLSRVRLCATPWTAAYQALLSMGFSRQEYWSGVPMPSPCIYEVTDISPSNLDSSLFFIQPSVSHDVLCIEVK